MLERRVTFLVRERADVELTCDQLVRIDRSGHVGGGRTAALLGSGSHRLSLQRGVYSLRARRGGVVRVVHGGVGVLPGAPGMELWPAPDASASDHDEETAAALGVGVPEEDGHERAGA